MQSKGDRKIQLVSELEGERIDSWISGRLEGCSRSYVQKLISDNLVEVNGKKVKANYKLKQGDVVDIVLPEPEPLDVKPEEIKIDIVYEDNDILVINKQKGLVVHPAAGNRTGTLVNALMHYCGENLSDINGVIRPGIVHRIDKDTSGLLVVAKNNHSHEKLSGLLKNHEIKRVYHAVAEGVIYENKGKIDAPIGRHPVDRKKMAVNVKNGRYAVTNFTVLERFRSETYVELELETGRTHQIRVHMSYIGHPLVGDELYGRRKQPYDTGGQVLHAKKLSFVHPSTGKFMEFETELPQYFKELLARLRA